MPATSLLPRPASLTKLLGLQPAEADKVLLFTTYLFLMGAAMAVYYTCTTSLFLTSFDRQQLPLAFVASGVSIYGLGWLVHWAQRRLPYVQVNAGLLLLTLLTVGGLLLASALHPNKWLYFALFLWNRGFIYVNGVVFWAMVGRVFSLDQSKRLFSFVGIGEVLASIVSYLSVPLLLRLVSADWLLLLAFGFLVICTGLMAHIRRRFHGELQAAPPRPAADHSPASRERDTASARVTRSYYALLSVLALLPVFGLVYVEFMFTVQSKQAYPDKQSLASFLGLFFGLCSVVELFIKAFLYNRLINSYSIRLGIVLLPLLLLFSYGLAASYGAVYGVTSLFFAYIALSRFFMSSVRRAISDPAFQVLFQPIPATERTLLQSRIEGGPKALGNVLPGLLLLLLTRLPGVTPVELCYVFLLVLVGWTLLAFRIQHGYRAMLNNAIMRLATRVYQQFSHDQPNPNADLPPTPPQPFSTAVALATSPTAADRRLAAAELSRSGRYHACHHILLLLHDADPGVREAALAASGRLGRTELWPRLFEHLSQPRYQAAAAAALLAVGTPVLPALGRLLKQGNLPDDQQVQLLKLATAIGGDAALRLLRLHMQHPRQLVREAVLDGLVRLHHHATVTERPYLGQQLDEYIAQMVWLMAARVDLTGFAPTSDILCGLRAEKVRLTEKMVTLLVVLYGDNRSDVIRELIIQENDELRGYLMELMSTTLPAQVRDRVILLFTRLPLAEKLRQAAGFYPQQQLPVEERLLDIINKNYNQLDSWTKAAAVLALPARPSLDPTLTLVAAATVPDPVLAEAALYRLHQLNPARFEELRLLWSAAPAATPHALAQRIAAGLAPSELQVRQCTPAPPRAVSEPVVPAPLLQVSSEV